MGIRTIGFEKTHRSSNSVDEGKSQKQKKEEVPLEGKSGGSGAPRAVPPVAKPPDVDVKSKSPQNTNKVVAERIKDKEPDKSNKKSPARSPIKARTPGSMARLSGMKATARKLKRHRKRSLYVQSASKILRSSIKSNKTRQVTRQQQQQEVKEKPQPRENGSPPQARISTRMLIRRSSREGIPEDPLRTVELIKRPLELREPATKLLYMASLGLYPNTGDSDMTPIVVVKEVCSSPGKKNGVRKSLELPLIPYHKRYMDLSHQDKRKAAENIKPTAGTSKQSQKQESRKTSPIPNQKTAENVEVKKSSERNQPQRKSSSPSPRSDAQAISTIISTSQAINAVSSITVTEVTKKNIPSTSTSSNFDIKNNLPLAAASRPSSSDLTITPSAIMNKLIPYPVSNTNQAATSSIALNSKSLLRANLSSNPPPPLKMASNVNVQHPYPVALNLATTNPPLKSEMSQPLSTNSILSSQCTVTNAMNLLMSNITILPASLPVSSRKRCASPLQMDQNTMTIRPVDSITCGNNVTISIPTIERKVPPAKRPKNSNETKTTRTSMPAMSSLPVATNMSQNAPYIPLLPQQVIDGEALNLCMKRGSEPTSIPALSQSPPKLQYKSEPRPLVNGSKPLNLIIPRPPPLTKAPLEITNIANCTQNLLPPITIGMKGHSNLPQPKKPRKLRQQNHNHITQPNHPQIHPTMPTLPLISAETAVQAKSLLKCMNGEENACREVGETLDSVKTMLARLQTSIGPAVNGVRLITIE